MWFVNATKTRSVKKKLEEATTELESDELAKNNALIRFYYKKDPERMSDKEWASAAAEIHYVLKYTGQIASLKSDDRIKIA